MDTLNALRFVQIAAYNLRKQYLGEKAGDELAVANTPVPAEFAELSAALHSAQEALLDSPPAWEDQAIESHADGVYRLKQFPELCKPAK